MAEIKAIVYESQTGFTKEYAEMLAEKLQVPAITTNDNSIFFGTRDQVIFLGWICAGKINGLRLANVKFNPVIIVGVGMTPPSDKYAYEIAMQNNIDKPFFYLQGGLRRERLSLFYKLLFKLHTNYILRKFKKDKRNTTRQERQMAFFIKNGGSFVNAESLKPVIEKYNNISDY